MRKLIVGVAIGIVIGSASTLMARSHIEDVDTLLSYLRGWFHDVESRADSRHQATAETLRRMEANQVDLKSKMAQLEHQRASLLDGHVQFHEWLDERLLRCEDVFAWSPFEELPYLSKKIAITRNVPNVRMDGLHIKEYSPTGGMYQPTRR